MARTKNSSKKQFLDNYNPAEAYLQRPKRKDGVPGILEGSSPNGAPLLIRVWPRNPKADDKDLIDIWRNELRLLHRLGGAPGAEEYIARLFDAGEDAQGFYIVIAAGQRRPLEVLRERGGPRTDWLRFPASNPNRRRLWANLRRVVFGLEVLHSQGLIHCNLDTWSVLSAGDIEPDFQLTGFEWSMRLMATVDKRKPNPVSTGRALSFLDDWKAFAVLAAQLLKLDMRRLENLKIPHHEVAESLSADEAWLLRELLNPRPHAQVDGAYVARRIGALLETLDDAAAVDEPQYQIVLDIGRSSGLTRAIREASDLKIEVDDTQAQLDFVLADLASPRVIAVGRPNDVNVVARGTDLVYRLRPYKPPHSEDATWEFSVCDRAEQAGEFRAPILAEDSLPPNSIRLMTFTEASRRITRVRGRVLSWDLVRRRLLDAAPKPQTREQRLLQAMTLLHSVELVATVAEAFAVKARPLNNGEGEFDLVEVTLQVDTDRDQLSEALNLRSADQRLEELLEREVADDEGWRLAESRTLGRRSAGDAELVFERAERSDQGTRFFFRRALATAIFPSEGILVPGEFRGRLSQFRRRANALRALSGHTELLRMLSDPRGAITASHESFPDDDFAQRLDPAKRDALHELSSVLPIYMVQGPPGVGKTFLVRELVRRRFAEEATSRLLLTAQSHHAVDHLMNQIQKDWPEPEKAPLAVRCRPSGVGETTGNYDLSSQCESTLSALSASELMQSCSLSLGQRLKDLISTKSNSNSHPQRADRRLVEGLIMRAANIVFATTNSGDLEQLLDERGQFDWAIVEEAGKATGVELLLPLLLSYRRLMIGDHKQLPPFGSEKLDALLTKPDSLRPAIRLGLELVERGLRDFIPDDLQALLESTEPSEAFAALCAESRRVLFLFENLVENEVERQSAPNSRGIPIARKLNIQHRMHPDIAQLVSRCFYDNNIETDEGARQRFANAACPIETVASSLVPDVPIVLIDMPYERLAKGSGDAERYPRYTNEQEVRATRGLLANLRGTPSGACPPSLAILSPYARQVTRLQRELLDDPAVCASLKGFQPVGRNEAWCSTVDAFQGNEADAVVISLVRNNHHATPRKALGFVSDPRRMNVLLSRAKWRLYIITSLDFLRTVTEPFGREDDQDGAFIREMLSALDEYIHTGVAARVNGADILEQMA
tara:strand:+ start:21242 stop:24775 length:3534 start_codon:yes stop_codon:yes gene_type:complete